MICSVYLKQKQRFSGPSLFILPHHGTRGSAAGDAAAK